MLEDLPPITLVRPDLRYKDSFLAGLAEMSVVAERRSWLYLARVDQEADALADLAGHVAGLLERELVARPGQVCDTVYWGVVGEEVVGRMSLRHALNDFLWNFGGHIGCIVRPSQRGKGLAGEMLRQLLLTERAQSIGRLLVTCDEGNTASEAVIRKFGGVLENVIDAGPDEPRKKRFWIDLGSAPPAH